MAKKRKLLFLCVLLLVLILLPAILFRAAAPFVKEVFIEETRKATGLQLDIETLRLQFPGLIQAEGVNLSDRNGASLISAGTIRASISLPALARKNITVTRLSIDSLFLHDSLADSLTAPDNEKDASKAGPFISINNISLTNSAFFISGRKTEIEIGRGNLTYNPDSNMDIFLDSVSLSGAGSKAEVQTLKASLNMSGNFPGIRNLLVETEGLKASGSLYSETEKGEMNGYFEAGGRLETLRDLAISVAHINLPELKGNFKLLSDISGTLQLPYATAELYFEEFSAGGRLFSALEINALADGSHINLEKAEITGIHGEKAFLSGKYDLYSHLADNFQLKIYQAPADGSFRIPGSPEEIEGGLINASLVFSGPAGEPQLWDSAGNFSLTAARLSGKELPGVTGDFLFRESAGNLKIKSDYAFIDARVKYGNPVFEGGYNLKVEEIESLLIYAGIEDISGSLDISGSFNYSRGDFRATSEIEKAQLLYSSIPLNIESGKIFLDRSGVSFRDITGRGKFIIEDSPFLSETEPRLGGYMSYVFTAHGSTDDPKAEFEIILADPLFDTFNADEFYFSGSYGNALLEISSFYLKKGRFLVLSESSFHPISMKGNMEMLTFRTPIADLPEGQELFDKAIRDFERAGKSSFSFDLQREEDIFLHYSEESFDIETGAELLELPYPLEGKLSADILFRGSAYDPEIKATVSIEDSTINGTAITNAFIDAQLREGIVSVKEFNLAGPRSGKVQGKFSFKARDIAGGVFFPDINHYSEGTLLIEQLDATLLNFFTREDAVASGSVSATLEWRGLPVSPAAEGFIRLEDFTVIAGDEKIPDISLYAYFSERKLLLENFSATLNNNPLTAAGTVEYPSRDRYLWDLAIKIAGEERALLTGTIENSRIEALCRIMSLNLADFSGYLPVEKPEGRVSADIKIEGFQESPEIYGNLRATRLAGNIEALKHPISGGAADILFNRNEIEIRRIFARSGRGVINASGRITHKNASPQSSEISLNASALEVELDNIGNGIVSLADLGFKGEEGLFVLNGEVHMSEFFVTADEHSAARREVSDGFTEQIQLALALHTGRNMWVYNQAGRIRLDGQLRAAGTAARPVLTGRIETKEGYVMYLDRKFNIADGYVDFDGRPENIPYIDVSARTRVRSLRQVEDRPYDITLRATGYVNDIQIYLTSRPHLEFADIVSLLTFGATRTQMTESERLLTLRAEELASVRVAGYISAYAGNMLNLDVVVIDGNVFRAGSPHGPRIQAQKGISENIALAYVGNLSPEDSALVARRAAGRTEIIYTEGIGRTEQQKLQLRYSLTPSLAAEALTDHTGRSNIGLKYSIWIP